MKTFIRDPNSKLDYQFDFTDELGATSPTDTIASYTLTATGVTLVSDSDDSYIITAWITGGSAGVTGTLHCRMTTTAGRIHDRTMVFNHIEL